MDLSKNLVVKDTIINLMIISKLQPHIRLDTSGKLYKIYGNENIIGASFWRWWSGFNRKQDIARLSTLYDSAIDYVHKHEEVKQMSEALKSSISGLINLKKTYEDDLTIVSSIEYIIGQVGSLNSK